MITNTMYGEQLINEVHADLRELQANVNRYTVQTLMPQYRRHQIKLPCFRWIECNTSRHNHYIIRIACLYPKEIQNPPHTEVAVYETDEGKKAVMVLDKYGKCPAVALEFEPHLFNRYAERKGVNKTGMELIKEFFLYNTTFMTVADYQRPNGGKYDVMLLCTDGAVFGEVFDGQGIMLKTFINRENMGKRLTGYDERYEVLMDKVKNEYMQEYFPERRQ